MRAIVESARVARAVRDARRGRGARALGWLASVPNCSRTLVEASVPYARESTVAIVGEARARGIERYASLEMAEALAEAAYARAVRHPSSRGRARRRRRPPRGGRDVLVDDGGGGEAR